MGNAFQHSFLKNHIDFIKRYIFLIFISFLLGCSGNKNIIPEGENSKDNTNNELAGLKDLVLRKLNYIMTPSETDSLPLIKDKTGLNKFLTEFWKRRDPTPQTSQNEYKEDYYSRIKSADTFFFERKPGSETERGRVLLIYGRPDNINKDNLPNGPVVLNDGSILKSYEIWIYDKPAGTNGMKENIFSNIYPGRMIFIFADLIGFGEFDLIYSTQQGEKTDPRVFAPF